MGQPVEVRVLSRAANQLNFELRVADWSGSDYLAAFLLAAHRAFMSWESLLRPAAVSPPFLLNPAFPPALLPPFCLAQRALAAADNLARVAAEIVRRPPADDARAEVLPRIEARRLSRVSICRRIATASSNDLRDKSMQPHIAGVERNGKQLF
jgi:hypothetical protein